VAAGLTLKHVACLAVDRYGEALRVGVEDLLKGQGLVKVPEGV